MRHHCQQCEDKDATIQYLKSELALIDDLHEANEVRRKAKLHGLSEAKIMLHLSRCRHHTATKLQLIEAIDSRGYSDTIDTYIYNLRKQFGHDAFETLWGVGVRMTSVGLARFSQVMND